MNFFLLFGRTSVSNIKLTVAHVHVYKLINFGTYLIRYYFYTFFSIPLLSEVKKYNETH